MFRDLCFVFLSRTCHGNHLVWISFTFNSTSLVYISKPLFVSRRVTLVSVMASKKAANRSWVNKTRKCTNGRCGQEKSLFFFLGEKSTEDPIMKWCYPCRLTHPLYRKINETTEKESAAAEAKDIILNWAAIKIEHFHNFVSTYCVVDERQTCSWL